MLKVPSKYFNIHTRFEAISVGLMRAVVVKEWSVEVHLMRFTVSNPYHSIEECSDIKMMLFYCLCGVLLLYLG